MTLCNASSLLKTVKDCTSAKVNKGRANPLTKEKVPEELKKLKSVEELFLVHVVVKIH